MICEKNSHLKQINIIDDFQHYVCFFFLHPSCHPGSKKLTTTLMNVISQKVGSQSSLVSFLLSHIWEGKYLVCGFCAYSLTSNLFCRGVDAVCWRVRTSLCYWREVSSADVLWGRLSDGISVRKPCRESWYGWSSCNKTRGTTMV